MENCINKQKKIEEAFSSCKSNEELYYQIIEWGKKLPPYPKEDKLPMFLVPGCQSLLYLKTSFDKGKMRFAAASDALISAGLAALLIEIYQDEPPKTLLHCPPTVIKTLGIPAALTPSRTNGLQSLFKRMQQDSLKFF